METVGFLGTSELHFKYKTVF